MTTFLVLVLGGAMLVAIVYIIYRCRQAPIRGRFVGLEGNISSGKSTVSGMLAKRPGFAVLPERISQDLLELYYANIKSVALTIQLVTQMRRIGEINLWRERLKTAPITVVQDRSIPGDLAFMIMQKFKGNMTDKQCKVYETETSLEDLAVTFRTIDTIVYLHSTPQRCKESVTLRCGPDKGVSLEYLTEYDEVIFHMMLHLMLKRVDVRMLNWTEFGEPNAFLELLDHPYRSAVSFGSTLPSDKAMEFVVLDYGASLVPLPSTALRPESNEKGETAPILDPKLRYVTSPDFKHKFVMAATTNRFILLLNRQPSLLDVFDHLSLLERSTARA